MLGARSSTAEQVDPSVVHSTWKNLRTKVSENGCSEGMDAVKAWIARACSGDRPRAAAADLKLLVK